MCYTSILSLPPPPSLPVTFTYCDLFSLLFSVSAIVELVCYVNVCVVCMCVLCAYVCCVNVCVVACVCMCVLCVCSDEGIGVNG